MSYTDDLKRDAVRLVTEQKCSIAAAAKAVGVSDPTMRQWVAQIAAPIPVCGPEATIDELRYENRRLKAALKRAELECEILKKATAFFARESP
jgi:transposase